MDLLGMRRKNDLIKRLIDEKDGMTTELDKLKRKCASLKESKDALSRTSAILGSINPLLFPYLRQPIFGKIIPENSRVSGKVITYASPESEDEFSEKWVLSMHDSNFENLPYANYASEGRCISFSNISMIAYVANKRFDEFHSALDKYNGLIYTLPLELPQELIVKPNDNLFVCYTPYGQDRLGLDNPVQNLGAVKEVKDILSKKE
jgi:hypothetical protein